MMFNLLKLVFNPLKLAESFISHYGGGGGGAAGPFTPGASGSRGDYSFGGGGGAGASGSLGASGATGATGYFGGAGGAGGMNGSPGNFGLVYGGGGGGAGGLGMHGASGAQGVIIFTYNDNAGATSAFTLASSGSISLGGLSGTPNRSVNARLGLGSYEQISLGSTGVRTVYNVASGAIRLANDGYGK